MILKSVTAIKSRKEANLAIAQADAARDSHNWAEAAQLYEAALKLDPDNGPIWVQLGNMNKEAGNHAEALAAYEQALKRDARNSDVHLQIGHLFKIMGRNDEATQSYRKALMLDADNQAAYNELVAAGMLDIAQKLTAGGSALSASAHNLIFDVSDLVFYLGHHAHLTGIQRVQVSVILSIVRKKLVERETLHFVSYDRTLGQFRLISTSQFLELLDDLTLPEEQRLVPFDQEKAKVGILFPGAVLSTVMPKGNATMVLLGAAWVIPDYASMIANLKRRFGCRFAMVFHDFIPIYARETCDQGTADVFAAFMDQTIALVDQALCVSQNTANDLQRYCAERDIAAPPVTVTRLGAGFSEIFPEVPAMGDGNAADFEIGEPFVLFVSTIEGRKNHDLALRIWRKLMAEGVTVPRLVCVGRLGWRSESFFQALIATDNLGGKVQILEDISDTQLAYLYDTCLFTMYPSLYEGWGLPVSESLDHGKVCVTTRAASLPEVAGEFGAYIPLDDLAGATAVVRSLIEDPQTLKAMEARIAAEYRPDTWQDVAQRIIDACSAKDEAANTAHYPRLLPRVEYLLRNPRTDTHGTMGQRMREIITEARQGVILGELASPHHINDALLMRNANWHEPEAWGCWTTAFSARLEFAVSPQDIQADGKLLFYLSITQPGGRGPAELHLKLGKSMVSPVIRRLAERVEQVVALSFPAEPILSAPPLANGLHPVTLDLTLKPASGASTPPAIPGDSRSIGFGLRSFVMVPESDLATRLAIVERQAFG